MKNVAVIGAGASGLFLTRRLLDLPYHVYIFEKCRNVGTKLRASGGGKANIFHVPVTPDAYNQPAFVSELLRKVDARRIQHEFENLGLRMMTDEEGRVYPLSQFSQTVVDVLWTPNHPNLHPALEYTVQRVWQQDGKWHVDDFSVVFDYVVFASGSPANMIPKNRQQYNAFLQPLRLQQSEFKPSLVGFKIKDYPKHLSGCRTKVIASLYQEDKLVVSESGEVTFKDDGISGIVILNLSAYYNRLSSKGNCTLVLDFLYDGASFDINAHWKRFHSMKGVLHPKLCALYDKHPFDLRHFVMEIEDVYDLEFAQVCHGGVSLNEVTDSFALKRYPNAFMTGEMLDVDGVCGGYNLFFAFASACVVADALRLA